MPLHISISFQDSDNYAATSPVYSSKGYFMTLPRSVFSVYKYEGAVMKVEVEVDNCGPEIIDEFHLVADKPPIFTFGTNGFYGVSSRGNTLEVETIKDGLLLTVILHTKFERETFHIMFTDQEV
jgi:hypothetical protein